MRKIKVLIDKGWMVDLQSNDGWYNVGANHNTWGDVNIWDENLSKAIDKMYDAATELELD